MSDDLGLPENVEREIRDGCTEDGVHAPSPCPRCLRLRRAIKAALLRREIAGHDTGYRCGKLRMDCTPWSQEKSAQADASNICLNGRRGGACTDFRIGERK